MKIEKVWSILEFCREKQQITVSKLTPSRSANS